MTAPSPPPRTGPARPACAPGRRAALRATLGLLALPAGVVGPAHAADTPAPQPWPAARPTPALQLPQHQGPTWSLAAQRGRVLLLNFWASWCEPCRSEMPSLELLAQRHEAERFDVVAINHRETDAAIARFLALMPITLPILRDADGGAARAFGVRIFPTTVAIGRDGRAAFSVVGEADWNGPDARRWLAPLLNK